jgi:hypothetical protein
LQAEFTCHKAQNAKIIKINLKVYALTFAFIEAAKRSNR